MRQIGLAFHQFEGQNGCFPPAYVWGDEPNTEAHRKFFLPPGPQHGWTVFLLPYLEQGALYEKYDFKADLRGPINKPVMETELGLFVCPTTPIPMGARKLPVKYLGNTTEHACTDYKVPIGISSVLAGRGLVDELIFATGFVDSLLSGNRPGRLEACTDGTSTTILLVESAGQPTRFVARGQPSSISTKISNGFWGGRDNYVVISGSDSTGYVKGGSVAVNGNNERDVYSFHPAGANACMVDGSVRLLSKSLSLRDLARMVTYRAGDIVTE